MQQDMFTFTKDYMASIAQASVFTYQRDERVMDATDALFGIREFTQKYPFKSLFWRFIGFESDSIIKGLLQDTYPTLKKIPKHSRLQFKLDGLFHQHYLALKKKGVKKFSFLTLLYVALDALSDEALVSLQEQKVEIEAIKEKLLQLIMMLDATELSPIKFFELLTQMMHSMGLTIDQMDMFMDISQIQDMKKTGNDNKKTKDTATPSFIAQTGEDLVGDMNNTSETSTADDEDSKLTIEYFATDLTDEARNNTLDPVIGRVKEIDQMIYTLLRKTKNNPLLIGEAGVGKTALVEGLAQRIVDNDVPMKLQDKRIMMLDMGSLVAGTKYRGEFESRLKAITEEAIDPTNNIILCIDEIHTIIGAGNAEGAADAANILKPLLARGKLQLIGATTFDEYQKHIEKDAALKRRFQELHVEEPSRDDAIAILTGLQERFEEYHGVVISSEAIEKAVDYSIRYMMNKHLPDKAIDIIDEASARVSTLEAKLSSNDAYTKLEKDIQGMSKKIEKAIEQQDYFKAAELKESEESMKQKLKGMRKQTSLPRHLRPVITFDHVGQVLADKLGIPLDQITSSEVQKLATLDTLLQESIYGQDEAVEAVVKAIRRNRLSAIEQQKPIGSFLFLGPSGVGKTYLAKLLATQFFGDDKALIRVDMSEYMEKHSISKLIGSAPGYVGYEEGGMLTEQVRRKPYSVILFDEIEKASPEIYNVMLQILDEGHLKDNKGRWIDFKNTIIIMTSNIGSEAFGKKLATIGFSSENDAKTYDEKKFATIKEKVIEEVKDHMAPELINRLSALVVFKPLTKEILGEIFTQKLKDFFSVWKKKDMIKLPRFGKKKIAKVIDDVYDPAYGARPLERYLHDTLEPQLIDQVMEYELKTTKK